MDIEVEYISFDAMLELHEEIIKESGGAEGVLYEASLQHLVLYLEEDFDITDKEDIFMASAIILKSIITQHPFIDGNKRTGLASADVFLIDNGYDLGIKAEESVDFCLSVARGDKNIDEIKHWLKKHTKKNFIGENNG